MANQAKVLRGQLKQIVLDLLPNILTEELKTRIYTELANMIQVRLQGIESEVKSTMNEINNRSKDAQDYLVRQVSSPIPSLKVESETPKA